MIIEFQKFQGAGNDFIIIDNRNQVYEFTREIVEYFCDRKFGIGADGLMLLETCPGYDFKMRYFNSDGREASLCGNGSRCIVAYAHRLGLFLQTTRFLAADGEHQGEITLQGVRVKLNDVSRIKVTPDYFFLDTGSPHYVKVVADAFQTDVVTAGRMIRYAPSFQPGGTNVNFITPTPACIRIATYERGVEDETLACGTGCVAAALSAALLNHDHSGTYTLQTKGGILKVSFAPHRLPHSVAVTMRHGATIILPRKVLPAGLSESPVLPIRRQLQAVCRFRFPGPFPIPSV